jgi:hypothetical protein
MEVDMAELIVNLMFAASLVIAVVLVRYDFI